MSPDRPTSPPDPLPMPDELPPPRAQRTADRARRRRLAATAALAGILLGVGIGVNLQSPAPAPPPQPVSAAAAVRQAQQPTEQQYLNEQQRAEIALLREALEEANAVSAHHRHHSEVMWDLLEGKISSREAWWRGGDATCAGWLAAGRFEKDVGRLQGREVNPPPIPQRGLAFCKQARERK
jgi:hypothetical protein